MAQLTDGLMPRITEVQNKFNLQGDLSPEEKEE